MDLNIGEIITAKRKEKSWTQEQLANAVGVSSPAVSKWETGTTYPDITLLSPIARSLNTTVDELLSFHKDLSSDKVSDFVKRATKIYEVDGFESGWNYCQELLQEYPNSIPLKFYLGNIFQSFMLMKPNIEQQEIQNYYKRAVDIYEDVLASGNAEFYYHTKVILISLYVMLNEPMRAQELLDSLPNIKVDPDSLYPSIYVLRDEHDKAIKLTQENIFKYISKVSQFLSVLCSYALEYANINKVHTIAKINFEMTRMFGMKSEIAYPDLISSFILQGDNQNALSYLETYVDSIICLNYSYSNNPIFSELSELPKDDTSYIKKILAQSILIDKRYDSLKEEQAYIQIDKKLRKVLES